MQRPMVKYGQSYSLCPLPHLRDQQLAGRLARIQGCSRSPRILRWVSLMLRYWAHWRRSLDLWDDLLAKSLNRFQSKPRIHSGPVHHEPHKLGVKLLVIGHHLLNHFGWASKYDSVLLQLVERQIVAFSGLPLPMVVLILSLVSISNSILRLL